MCSLYKAWFGIWQGDLIHFALIPVAWTCCGECFTALQNDRLSHFTLIIINDSPCRLWFGTGGGCEAVGRCVSVASAVVNRCWMEWGSGESRSCFSPGGLRYDTIRFLSPSARLKSKPDGSGEKMPEKYRLHRDLDANKGFCGKKDRF